jgi:hypothetical protein
MWDRRHSTTPHVAGVLGTFEDGVGYGSTAGGFGTSRVPCVWSELLSSKATPSPLRSDANVD